MMSSRLQETNAMASEVAQVHSPKSYSPDSLTSARLSYYDERLSILEASSSDQLSSVGYGASFAAEITRTFDDRGSEFDASSTDVGANTRLVLNEDNRNRDGLSSRGASESGLSLDESRVPLRQAWSDENEFDDEIPPLKVKKKKHVSLKIASDEDLQVRKQPSFSFLGEEGQSNQRKCHGHSGLLRGPRKVLRLCIFALIIPLGLVVVPLYIRTVRYPPQMLAMAPSDQRLLGSSVSSIWCQSQSVQMNGSFNAYLLADKPETKPARPRYTILKNLKLRDDVKEYWGFYLRGGSTVTLSSCTRYDGGQLMILRGSENLHRCAWIGEEDSLEETAAKMPSKADLDNVRVDLDPHSDEYENEGASRQIGSRIFTAPKENVVIEGFLEQSWNSGVQPVRNDEEVETVSQDRNDEFGAPAVKAEEQYESLVSRKEVEVHEPPVEKADKFNERPVEVFAKFTEQSATEADGFTESHTKLTSFQTSEERQEHLSLLLKHALAISKGKDEVMNALVSHTEQQINDEGMLQKDNEENLGKFKVTDQPSDLGISHNFIDKLTAKETSYKTIVKREVTEEKESEEDDRTDGAFEVTDDDLQQKQAIKKFTKEEIGVEQIIGGLSIPDGLTYERGFMNQTHGGDMSMEEHRSSYSSSEEALASCDGVILALLLQPDSHCSGFNRQESNKVTYEITEDGTYYFVFSSDNEILVNDLFFNLTLDKVVYDTSSNLANCSHSQNCSLHLDFWSNEETIVEVPADSSWDNSYVLNTECQPRVAVYLCLLMLVPILILMCAFQ